jgi:MFS family permease
LSPPQPGWVGALWVTLLAQTVASLLTQALPAMGPLMTGATGLGPEAIGNLSSVGALGTVLFLLAGGGVLARFGPVRTLQIGAAVLAFAMVLAAQGSVVALVVASALLGIGYAPAAPAGSQILQETAPRQHRALIFSVKQAGAPLGGVLAGLLCAPAAAWLGWQAVMLLGAVLAIASIFMIQPQRVALDRPGAPRGKTSGRGMRHMLLAPLVALRLHPRLPPLVALGTALSTSQGCLFSFCVTWLVTARGMGLVEAGGVFAAMQAAGVVARLVLGWLADRTGTASRNLVVQAFCAAASLVIFAAGALGEGIVAVTLMAAAAGALVGSWNGIVMSEIAGLVPPEKVGEATAGCTMLVFLGYLLGPSLFAALVAATGNWTLAFMLVAAQLFAVATVSAVALRRLSAG